MPFSSTTTFKALFICYMGLFPSLLSAQVAVIEGMAPEFAGFEIELLLYRDPISREVQSQNRGSIAEDGSFKLSLEVPDTTQVWLWMRRFSAPIFVHPGAHLHIALDEEMERVLLTTWQRGRLGYRFVREKSAQVEGDTSEIPGLALNEAVAQMDAAYYRFFAENAAKMQSRSIRNVLKGYCEEHLPQGQSTDYLNTYAACTAAEMQLAIGWPKNQVFETNMAHNEIQLNHPAWFSLFQLFFSGFFTSYSNRFGGAEMHNRLAAGMDYAQLDSAAMAYDFLERTDLRQLALLLNIAEVRKDKRYTKSALLSLCRELEANAASDELRELAHALGNQLEKEGDGIEMKEMLQNAALDMNKPVYIFVSAPWSKASKREAASLTGLIEKYGGYFQALEVSISESERSALGPWPIRYLPESRDLLDAWNVYSIPHAFWVKTTTDGTGTEAPLPSSGLEKKLFKLKAEKEEGEKIRIGK